MTSSLLRSAVMRGGMAERIWFVILNQVDLILTVFAVSIGLTELNPWMRNLLAAAPIQLFLVKSAIPSVIAWFVPGKLLIPSIALLLFVVTWDLKELLYFLFLK